MRNVNRKKLPAAWMTGVLLAIMTMVAAALQAAAGSDVRRQPPRIISTDAGATELILALGAGEHLIAVDVTTQLPDGFRDLPNVGYHRNLSPEGLLALQPTLVVGSDHIGPEVVLRALRQADIAVVQLPTAHTPAQLRANVDTLATALDRQADARPLLDQLAQKLAYLEAHPLDGSRAAFLLNTDPGKLRLAGAHTAGAALLQLIGSTNVATYPNYRTVAAEALLALRPEIILIAGQNPEQDAQQLMRTHSVLAHTPAGHEQRIIGIKGSCLVAGLSLAAIDEAVRLVDLIGASGAELAGPVPSRAVQARAVQARTVQARALQARTTLSGSGL